MNKIYKINPSLINKVAYRPLKRITIIFTLILLYFYFMQMQFYYQQKLETNTTYLPLIMPFVLLGLILFYSFRLRKRVYANLEILINDEGIQKSINYPMPSKVNFIDRLIINSANHLTSLYNNSLTWERITAIDEKPRDLYIKTVSANNFYGSGQIIIPKEIEQYEEIKK